MSTSVKTGAGLLGRAALVLGVVAALCVAAPVAHADDGTITWAVTPATESGPDGRGIIEQELDPGASTQDHFAVRNLSTVTVTFRLTAADGYYTANGRFDMLPSSEESVDAGTWIDLPPSVTVEPNATAVVPFTTTVPDDAMPGDHAAGIAASVLSAGTDAAGSEVGVESRIGFRLMTRVTGEITPAVEITEAGGAYDLSWNPFRPGSATVDFTVRNTGNTSVALAGAVTAGTGSTAFPAAGQPQYPLLPGAERSFSLPVSDVWPLLLVPTAISLTPSAYDFGGDSVPISAVTADLALWAIPAPQLGLVIGVALILTALFWGRRRSARNLASALAAAREEGRAAAAGQAASADRPRSDGLPTP
ncbi:DUF916 domain-containing protein [Microbacterium sp. zg.Y1090]|uniref:DUF916 domain-containing protein n=1 Tax=Microbacterium TaxID=33882 RepID=UPI00214CC5E0|nr:MULTISPECIES: DUF916 domain-containing protein [unclassified Microbacterium]MCR2812423.1 DUF916 domain-containing protein [Microbacterium sp. zg.Y1084]MCR2817776.1 DUF916 domain-containing protein [Microbacterium sp. zg.Y1090]MDL5485580.1 DUF916 domain-containing protein [Microbacterium sp. zg-Y1211]WIM28751.1 DUF916 domain-containing protein [Microbacterium sp. zg-Y1090]